VENYIVRIYRRDQDNPEQVTGILESVEQETRQTFHTLKTLHAFLQECPLTPVFSESSPGHATSNNPKTVGLGD
jgi:hypothetical protein